jgi:MSHA biogenesis protein MshO
MQLNRKFQHGFTLFEMIVVMVITGILGGMIALLIKGPVQGYVDSARRADMTDISDTVLSRMTRDLRLAVPNSVRVTRVGGVYYLEFIPTTGGGRYSEQAFSSTSFNVLGPMPDFSSSSSIVIGNTFNSGASSVYENYNVGFGVSSAASHVTLASGSVSSVSPGDRFQVISTPVTYACSPAASGVGGTLTRYWGYTMTDPQPTSLAYLASANSGALLATNVSACSFNYVSTGSGLVTLYLTIAESSESESVESISLYDTANVANRP